MVLEEESTMSDNLITRFRLGLRRLAKASLAYTAYHSGTVDWISSYRNSIKLSNRIIILGYHRVVKDFTHSSKLSIPSLLISAQTFRRHLDLIRKNYCCVSLDEALDMISGRYTPKRDCVALTFDDGYQDFYDVAFPILQEYSMPATLFVPTSLLGHKTPLLHDQIYYLVMEATKRNISIISILEAQGITKPLPALRRALNYRNNDYYEAMRALHEIPRTKLEILIDAIKAKLNFNEAHFPEEYRLLNWSMVRELAKANITIGAHTLNHALLTEESLNVAELEIYGSKVELEDKLDMPVRHFAYPDGRYNSHIAKLVRISGFDSACTVEDRPNTLLEDPFQLKRKILWERACPGIFNSFSNIVAECHLRGLFTNAIYKMPEAQVNRHE